MSDSSAAVSLRSFKSRPSRPAALSFDLADPKESFRRDSLLHLHDSKMYESGSPSHSQLPANFLFSSAPALPPVAKDDPTVLSWLNYLKNNGIQAIVFDMDRTLVSVHSAGALSLSDIDSFRHALTPTCKILLPLLIEHGFHVGVATFCDDYYTQSKAQFPQYAGGDYISGVPLVHAVLSLVLTPEQLKQVIIVAMNPDLYGHASTPTQSKVIQMRLPRFLFNKKGSGATASVHGRRPSMSVTIDTPSSAIRFTGGNRISIEANDQNNITIRASEATIQILDGSPAPPPGSVIPSLMGRRLSGRMQHSHTVAQLEANTAAMLNSISTKHSIFLPADILESPPDSPLPQPMPMEFPSPLAKSPSGRPNEEPASPPPIGKSPPPPPLVSGKSSAASGSASKATQKAAESPSFWSRLVGCFCCHTRISHLMSTADGSVAAADRSAPQPNNWFYEDLYGSKVNSGAESEGKSGTQDEKESTSPNATQRNNKSTDGKMRLPNVVDDSASGDSNLQPLQPPTPSGSLPSPHTQSSEKRSARAVPKLTIHPSGHEQEISKANRGAISRVAISRANFHQSTGMIHLESKPLQQSSKHQFYSNKLTALGITVGSDKFGSAGQYPPAPYKNQHILVMYRVWNAQKRVLNGLQSMLLIDDAEENVEAARSLGAWGILVASKAGLVVGDLFQIAKPYEQYIDVGSN